MCSAKKYHLFYYSFTRFCWISLRSEFNHIEKSLVYHILFTLLKWNYKIEKYSFYLEVQKQALFLKECTSTIFFLKKSVLPLLLFYHILKFQLKGRYYIPSLHNLTIGEFSGRNWYFFLNFANWKMSMNGGSLGGCW